MDDTLEMQEDDELEEEADAEVDKVLFELTDGKLGEAGSVGTELPVIRLSLLDSFLAHICDRQHKMHLTSVKRRRSLNTDGSSIIYSVDKVRETWTFIPQFYIALFPLCILVISINVYSVMLSKRWVGLLHAVISDSPREVFRCASGAQVVPLRPIF